MKTFRTYLEEKVLNIGLNPAHEKHREAYRGEMHDMLRKSYESIGGYGGLGSGSKEESDAIHADLSSTMIKATRRNGKISSVRLYKPSHGRKSIAIGTDGTPQGKKDFRQTVIDDHTQKRSWGEVSGAPEAIHRKMGYPVIHPSRAKELTGKDVTQVDDEHYARKIGGHMHVKAMMGYPK